MAESADIGFLHDVLGLAIVAHKTTGEAIKALTVRLHDGAERTAFSRHRPMRQFQVVGCSDKFCQIASSAVHERLHHLHQMTFDTKGSQNSRTCKALSVLIAWAVPGRKVEELACTFSG